MKRSDRSTTDQHDESPAPGVGQPVSEANAANVGPATPGGGPGGRNSPHTPPTPSVRRGRTRRKPFVLRAAGATEAKEDDNAARPGSRLVRLLQSLGPYLLIEVLLPGGTLIAFLLYASRNGRPFREDAPVLATLAALVAAATQAIARWIPLDVFRLAGAKPAARDGLEPLGMAPG